MLIHGFYFVAWCKSIFQIQYKSCLIVYFDVLSYYQQVSSKHSMHMTYRSFLTCSSDHLGSWGVGLFIKIHVFLKSKLLLIQSKYISNTNLLLYKELWFTILLSNIFKLATYNWYNYSELTSWSKGFIWKWESKVFHSILSQTLLQFAETFEEAIT